MQTIARGQTGCFPDKDNGLIVDYVGVFRNLERALAIYAADRTDAGVDSPIRPKDDLIAELEVALAEVTEFCEGNDIDLADMEAAQGFEFVALQKAAVEALLIDEQNPAAGYVVAGPAGTQDLQGTAARSRSDGGHSPGGRDPLDRIEDRVLVGGARHQQGDGLGVGPA